MGGKIHKKRHLVHKQVSNTEKGHNFGTSVHFFQMFIKFYFIQFSIICSCNVYQRAGRAIKEIQFIYRYRMSCAFNIPEVNTVVANMIIDPQAGSFDVNRRRNFNVFLLDFEKHRKSVEKSASN